MELRFNCLVESCKPPIQLLPNVRGEESAFLEFCRASCFVSLWTWEHRSLNSTEQLGA